MVLFARRPPKVRQVSHSHIRRRLIAVAAPQGRRLLVLATTSLRPILTDLGLSESFDSEIRVPPIASLQALERVLDEVELFKDPRERARTMQLLTQAGFGGRDQMDVDGNGLNIGIKKLLSVIEMARQEPEAVGERLVNSLMGLGSTLR